MKSILCPNVLRQKTEAENEPRPFPQDFPGAGYSVGLRLSSVSRSQRFDSHAAGGGRPFLCGIPGKGREHDLTLCEPATVASLSLSVFQSFSLYTLCDLSPAAQIS